MFIRPVMDSDYFTTSITRHISSVSPLVITVTLTYASGALDSVAHSTPQPQTAVAKSGLGWFTIQ